MAINEIRQIRLEKLKKLEAAGVNPYPAKASRTHQISEVLLGFAKLKKTKKQVVVAGRITSQRGHGGLLFVDIQDGSTCSGQRIQVVLKKDKMGEKSFQLFVDCFDIGDFIEVKGVLFETKTKEKSIEGVSCRMLAKSLLPLPEKFHGLQDEEERLRKRYLDILFNPEIKAMVEKRAVFWQAMRNFMKQKGFLEVETPVLEITPGGADARPFITHHNALGLDVYLRISTGELWQKRLMVAGLEKTFEIGRQFRNEGMDAEHLQDYTQMEFYWAYADKNDCMKLAQELFRYVAKTTFGTLKFQIGDFKIDLAKKWQVFDYRSIIKKFTQIDIEKADLPVMEKALQKLAVLYDKKGFNKSRAIDNLWKYCRKKIAGPGFLINEPIEVSPLAKKSEKNPKTAERFHIILAGSELANGYSELNDPLDQAQRFKEQQKLRDQGDEEAQMYDQDFVEALEYGMPPTVGFGVSERLFAFLMNKPGRECQIFPLMRPKR